MDIPHRLVQEIQEGRVALFLGAGAVAGAKSNEGKTAPLGSELGDILSEEFLGGKFKDRDLDWIAELAKSETDLITVQDYVSEVLRPLKPSDYHKLIPEFRWQGIATTNYDDIIEKAYENHDDSVQNLVPFISDKDRVQENLKTQDDLAYVKLHGSITRTHEESVPLVLSHDQYATVDKGRTRLFKLVEDWGYEFPIVFVGHELYDSDIRQLLNKLTELGEYRPRYYLIKPNVEEVEKRLWSSKKITVLSGTFKEFLEGLDTEIPKGKRPLFKVMETHEHPIESRFKNDDGISPSLDEFLTSDVRYVHSSMAIQNGDPKDFYKGYNLGWYPIAQNLDVRRNQTDTILFDVLLANEEDRSTEVEFYVIKAEAGAGKSILLKRVAWDGAIEGNCLCLYAKDFTQIKYESVYEIYQQSEERIFLFIDNASKHVDDISYLLDKAREDGIKLTIISAERINIWNISCENSLNQYLTESHKLRYLSREEIKKLLDKLEANDSLGRLKGMEREEQADEFEKVAGRQLLVALHEATLGKPFEEIIKDEYESIRPKIARSLYLSVCTLNRMDIPVRAGLIARVHNIPFVRFKERLFDPLEHVVKVQEDKAIGEYMYAARHSEIAEMVFEQILQTADDKFSEYMELLHEMNTIYSTDKKAFVGLIKANSILEYFPEYQMAKQIYEIADEVSPGDKDVYHQRAIYEMKRDQPNFTKAEEFLDKAKSLASYDYSITHSLAELYRRRAKASDKSLEKEKYRDECKKYAKRLLRKSNNSTYGRHTLIKLHKNRLKELLESPYENSKEIDKVVKVIEKYLDEGLQESPGDPYLKVAESELNELLKKHGEALESLEKAFEKNQRDAYLATRLSKAYMNEEKYKDAKEVLEIALEKNRGNKKIHFNYALVLKKLESTNLDNLIYHFRRGFTKWDENYDSQFWYARYCFESKEEEKREEAKEVFKNLREAWIPYEIRTEIRDKVQKDGTPKRFVGSLAQIERTYGFINVEGSGRKIFVHENDVGKEWDSLKSNKRVEFEIGFTMRGPVATNVDIYN